MPGNHLDVAAKIRQRIEAGEYGADRPLPAERVLSEAFGVHRATLRRALASLVGSGHVRRAPGERPYPVAPARPLEGTIGLYAAEGDDPYARSLIATGIVEALRERGSSLLLSWSDDHAFRTGEMFSDELSQQVGLVLWPPLLADLDRLRDLRRRVPMVVVDTPVGGFEADFVGFDDEGAGYEAARHLVDAGHRRIAFVGTLQAHTARFRHHGFLRLLGERGLRPVEGREGLAYANHLPASVVDAFLDVSAEERPTALLCENDETAALIMPHLGQRGLGVPQDFALVGFGGCQPVLLDALGLTTMEQPYVEMGRHAARLLLERLGGGRGEAASIGLSMCLKVRASSGGRPAADGPETAQAARRARRGS